MADAPNKGITISTATIKNAPMDKDIPIAILVDTMTGGIPTPLAKGATTLTYAATAKRRTQPLSAVQVGITNTRQGGQPVALAICFGYCSVSGEQDYTKQADAIAP